VNCKNCKNYKPHGDTRNVEISAQLAPDMGKLSGICSVGNMQCQSSDKCRINSYMKK